MRWMIFVLLGLFFVSFASAAIPGDCDSNMVAYWQMEGNADDSFGNHDGVSSSWPGTAIGFVVNNAARFDGGDDMISISDTGQVLDLHEGAFAIEFWVQKDEFADPADAFLLNKGNYNIKWTVANEIEATVIGNQGSATVTSLPISDLTVGHHIVLTWLSAAQNLTLYINNNFEASATLANPGISSNPLEIGENFVGLIDEVALYDRSFDADDVNFHWSTSAGGRDYCYTAGAGNVSSTRADFTLAGCALPGGGSISAGSCSRNGMFYCGNVSLILYDTLGINPFIPSNRGCSLEQLTYESGTIQCCPSGYLCGDDLDTEESELVCNLRTIECEIQESPSACDEAGCFWIDEDDGICVDNPLDYSCSIYLSKDSCNMDIWNVGAAGMGTEVCGTYFIVNNQGYVIPQDSCKCDWTASDKCVLGYDVVPDIYGENPQSFRCNKDFDAGECIDGLQQVTWSADAENVQFWNMDSQEFRDVLEAAGCVNNTEGIMRSCGEPIIKLPGFSLFALISSLGIIGLVYFWKRE